MAAEARQNLIDAMTMLEHLSIIDFNGHASICNPDGTILINSGASTRSALRDGDIVTIDGEGELIAGEARPPLELHIHTEIYRRRPDVNAVIHAHPRWSTFFTSAGEPIRPVFAQGCLAGDLAVYLEDNAERLYRTLQLGEPYYFSEDEIEACRNNLFKRGLFEKCWNYYRAKFGLTHR